MLITKQAYAASSFDTTTYTPIETIDNLVSDKVNVVGFGYVGSLYNYALFLTVALAFVMLVIGGVQYMIPAPGSKGDGQSKINGAITGLILALSSWLILNTINTNLTKGDLSSLGKLPAPSATTGYTPGGAIDPANYKPKADHKVTGGMTNDAARKALEKISNIKFQMLDCRVAPRPCSDFEGVKVTTINYTEKIAAQMKERYQSSGTTAQTLVVNDATGPGHSEAGHYTGNKIDFDDTASLNSFIENNKSRFPKIDNPASRYNQYSDTQNPGVIWQKEGDHWDVYVPG